MPKTIQNRSLDFYDLNVAQVVPLDGSLIPGETTDQGAYANLVWIANPEEISGGGGSGGLTDAQLRAAPVTVSGAVNSNISPNNPATTSLNITGNAQSIGIDCSAISTLLLHCVGTFSTVNVTFEGSLNATSATTGNWFTLSVLRTNANTVETATGNLSAAPAYGWRVSVAGLRWIRVRSTAFTSGTQTWIFSPSALAVDPIVASQVSGTQTISGTVTANEGTLTAPSTNILNSAATTNGTVIKASAGTLYSISYCNNSASVRYLKLHNSTTVTVGTTAVAMIFILPANSSNTIEFGAVGIRFTTGICLSITGGNVDNDTTAIGVSEVKVITAFI